ncbi:MAG: type II secretion system protein M [Butyrivibrio sp.]|nr:type II secretion system protein M [Butyrivibrio sp.]
MHIQMEMTDRDKKLLYRLGIVVVIAIFILGAIRPLYQSIEEKNEQIEAAEETKDVLDYKVAALPGMQQEDEKLQEEISVLNESYYEPMYSSEIDELLTNYMLGMGLMAKDLVITMPSSPVVLEPFIYSEEGKTSSASTDTSSEDSEVLNTTYSQIYAVTVSMKVEGAEDSLTDMLDDVDDHKPSVRVVSCNWSDAGKTAVVNDDGEIELQESSNLQLQLTLQLFMTGLKE